MRSLVQDFIHLFYPETCTGCGVTLLDNEQTICVACRVNLPVAYHDLMHNDKMSQLFYARVAIEHCTSLLYYEKVGTVQRLVHALKYQQQEQIGLFLGKWIGSLMCDDERFKDVDMVVGVPVHPKRKRKRGYNQTTQFGKCIAAGLGVRFRESVLTKTRNTIKQAQLNQRQRSDESQSPYQITEAFEPGLHILLVDDVVTTGTTLTLCTRALQQVANTRISIATMGISV